MERLEVELLVCDEYVAIDVVEGQDPFGEYIGFF